MSAIDGFVIESKPVAHFGVGAIDQLPGVIRATGAGQVVVVTDNALASTPRSRRLAPCWPTRACRPACSPACTPTRPPTT
jgi:hypothetical protein